MTFAALEESRDLGAPVYLYLFKYGPEAESCYPYTNAEADQAWDGISYAPTTITHSEINVSGTLDKTSVKVSVARSSPVVAQVGTEFSSAIIGILIYKGHATGTPDFKLEWVGRILGASRSGSEVEYVCEPISTSMRRKGLRKRMQRQCGKLLYGPRCRANKVEVTSVHAVTGVDGAFVDLPASWNVHAPAAKYQGGLAWWVTSEGRTETRSIIQVDGNTLILSALATNLAISDEVSIAPGCNHLAGLEDDCVVIHNNIHNYGGCPWIPDVNPFGIKNNFY